jgi:SAM-dependent methyltransferase
MKDTISFYNDLAEYYHLIYPDWEASIQKQADALDAVLKAYQIGDSAKILDVSCGIGTQVLGLAKLGYKVSASDISEGALAKAAEYAAERNLRIDFQPGDMRKVDRVFSESFDAVIACDNSVPHLLSDADILTAFQAFNKLLDPDGIVLISVRDYASLELGGVQVHPRQVRQDGSALIYLWDVWEFEGDQYSITIYLIRDEIGKPPIIKAIPGGQYNPVTIEKLKLLFRQAGYSKVDVLKGAYFQPLIVAGKTYQ